MHLESRNRIHIIVLMVKSKSVQVSASFKLDLRYSDYYREGYSIYNSIDRKVTFHLILYDLNEYIVLSDKNSKNTCTYNA